jgi:hypothetical protein
VPWSVEVTDEFTLWFEALPDEETEATITAVDMLQEHGPALGRPMADTVKGSRHSNLKELRVPRHDTRVLFAFDPRRTAILLIGGSKTNRWKEWYQEMIPVADRLYNEHLETLRKEGLL